MRRIRFLAAALLLIAGVACVDNSGGEPPPGTSVALEDRPDLRNIDCNLGGSIPGQVALLQSEADVDAWLSECDGSALEEGTRAALVAAANESSDDKKLIGIRKGWGGCVRDWTLMGLYHDAATLNVWGMLSDNSYGEFEAVCTLDLIGQTQYVFATDGDFGSVTEAALVVGRFNPGLPGAPLLPGE